MYEQDDLWKQSVCFDQFKQLNDASIKRSGLSRLELQDIF